MRVQVIGAASQAPGHPLSTFLVNDSVSLDAGALGWFAPVEIQAKIRHILLTHAHIDHIAGLPVLLDNVYGLVSPAPVVHGLPETLNSLNAHLFNNQLMPDFVQMSLEMAPFLELREFAPGIPFTVDDLTITPILLRHTIPNVGFLVDDGQSAVLFLSDTSVMRELFRPLAELPRLRAVFLEASFPDSHAELAHLTHHLTSSQFVEWAKEFPGDLPVYAIHLKSRFVAQIAAEIRQQAPKNVQIAEAGLIVEL